MTKAAWITGLCLLLVACGGGPSVSPLEPSATVLPSVTASRAGLARPPAVAIPKRSPT